MRRYVYILIKIEDDIESIIGVYTSYNKAELAQSITTGYTTIVKEQLN